MPAVQTEYRENMRPEAPSPSKIDPSCLRRIEEAFEQYKVAINDSTLAPTTKETYISRASYFVRWLSNDSPIR